MAEIEEVPILDAPIAEAVEEPEPVEAAPKKRGRPKGSANKPKAVVVKAKPKRAPKKQATPVESEEDDTPPPAPRKSRRVCVEESEDSVSPPRATTQDIAAEVLQLLSNRHVDRTTARRQKYASWFPNRAVY